MPIHGEGSSSNGGTSFPSDSITLKRLDTGAAETAQVDVEYYSPEQHGGIYGTVVRLYFTTSLPAALTSGNNVADLTGFWTLSTDTVDRISNQGVINAVGVADERVHVALSGTSGNGNLVIVAATWTLIKGWVDYVKA